jgi:hypothetical protein
MAGASKYAPPADDVDEDHDDGHDQKNVDEPAQRIGTDQAE